MGFISDEGDNHAVEIEEEEDQVKAELGKRFLRHLLVLPSFRMDLSPVSLPSCAR